MATTAAQGSTARPADRQLGRTAAGPLAGPAAWAVTAFATTSFMLGMYNTHLIGSGSLPIVFPVAFFFGGLAQILVAILEIGRGKYSALSCSAATDRSG
jgi:hypothetical protein